MLPVSWLELSDSTLPSLPPQPPQQHQHHHQRHFTQHYHHQLLSTAFERGHTADTPQLSERRQVG
jgi:hypothetical protein